MESITATDRMIARKVARLEQQRLLREAYQRPCRLCGAQPGQLCLSAAGNRRLAVHWPRKQYYWEKWLRKQSK